MIITSPVDKFPGTVVLPDFLLMPHVLAFESMSDRLREMVKAHDGDSETVMKLSEFDVIKLPVILLIVQEWHIQNVPDKPTVDTFPFSPRVESSKLISWINQEVIKLYNGEIDIPNA